jgi:hypothetical protein
MMNIRNSKSVGREVVSEVRHLTPVLDDVG